MAKSRLSILVTGVSGSNTGTQILESLLEKKEKYRLVTTDINPLAYGSIMSDVFHRVPPAAHPDYLKKILDICESEHIDAIIPGSEPELECLTMNSEIFSKNGFPLLTNKREVVKMCMDKSRTASWLKKSRFSYLPTMILELGNEAEKIVDELLTVLRFPIVVKPYLYSGGSANLHLVQDVEELILCLKLLKRSGLHLIAQEYDGFSTEEYTVGVMSGPDGSAFSSFALKRQHDTTLSCKFRVKNLDKERIKEDYLIISTGISQGWVDDYPEVRRFAENVANALGSVGPLNIQCRQSPRGFLIFEINPRFSGSTSIRTLCGHNDPDLIIRRHLFGEDLGQVPYKSGLVTRSLRNSLREGVHE